MFAWLVDWLVECVVGCLGFGNKGLILYHRLDLNSTSSCLCLLRAGITKYRQLCLAFPNFNRFVLLGSNISIHPSFIHSCIQVSTRNYHNLEPTNGKTMSMRKITKICAALHFILLHKRTVHNSLNNPYSQVQSSFL